jgi:hexosaminidase
MMNEYAIIPQPVSISYQTGNFQCAGLPAIAEADARLFSGEARVFTEQVIKTWGEGVIRGSGAIRLIQKPAAQATVAGNASGEESYRLEILADEIRLSAAEGAGIFSGLQVLRQLFLSAYQDGSINVPCGIIEDKPRFPWRGFMLDCSRNFFAVEFIKKLLDALSLQHINIFHWHLSDDQGWRLPVEKYPLLTEIGSRRYDSLVCRYFGGFYTQADIKGIVAYAAERHIEVVPEIDFPGHASSILAAYPGLGCTGGPYRVEERWGIMEDVLCAGNDDIFPLMEAVFDTLAGLFPSKYVHIGGDEVRFNRWKECPKCRKRMEELGVSEEEQMQSWITSRLAGMVRSRGKTAIGWDEILENTEKFPLPDDVVIMSWRNQEGGSKAAGLGLRVIMTPCNSGCYLDYKNIGLPEEVGQIGVNTINQGFKFEPVTREMDEKAASLVLGGQGNLWAEAVYAGKIAEYLIFHRICAISEALWSARDSRASEKPGIEDFARRLAVHQNRLDKLGLLQYRGPLE